MHNDQEKGRQYAYYFTESEPEYAYKRYAYKKKPNMQPTWDRDIIVHYLQFQVEKYQHISSTRLL